MDAKINRIMFAGTNSGCGKTTITCAILKALINKNLKVSSFKCGPDYIDPMFHSKILKAKSRNIDLFLLDEAVSKYLFAKNSVGSDISIVEGVMGFYDGLCGNTTTNSSCDISNKLNIPVVLIVDCRGAALSVVATIKGFLEFHKNNIKAVILNNASEMMYPIYKQAIESHTNISVIGYFPKQQNIILESRHLGLVTADEVQNLNEKMDELAIVAQKTIDLNAILKIAEQADVFDYQEISHSKIADVKIAVAKDEAFCFYYEDSLNLLCELGANLITFSPLNDSCLPENIDGIILGGGYPELHLQKLSNNKKMLKSINEACKNGVPVFAECGGFMYLGKQINGYSAVGAINMSCEMTNKLQNFGYITLSPKYNTDFFPQTENINAHEFHYSKSNLDKFSLTATKPNGKMWEAGFIENNIFALYPHIHFYGNIELAKRFIKKCEEYKNGSTN